MHCTSLTVSIYFICSENITISDRTHQLKWCHQVKLYHLAMVGAQSDVPTIVTVSGQAPNVFKIVTR